MTLPCRAAKVKRDSGFLHCNASRGNRLHRRHPRIKADIVWAELSTLAGIQKHCIAEVENGVHDVTLGTTVSLAEVLGGKVMECWGSVPADRERGAPVDWRSVIGGDTLPLGQA